MHYIAIFQQHQHKHLNKLSKSEIKNVFKMGCTQQNRRICTRLAGIVIVVFMKSFLYKTLNTIRKSSNVPGLRYYTRYRKYENFIIIVIVNDQRRALEFAIGGR